MTNTSKLIGAELNYWVARAAGLISAPMPGSSQLHWLLVDGRYVDPTTTQRTFAPSMYWAQGGPIIERELIEISTERDWREDGDFGQIWVGVGRGGYFCGDTPLVAAMRAYVGLKFGLDVSDEVQP